MKKNVLLINSDLAKNRGDRAIAEGLIELIRDTIPNADITGISEVAKRDKDWFGINFLEMDTQSLNPVDFYKLCVAAKRSDIILWGGGEILKDYTNKAALWYWALKIWVLSIINPNVYGSYQGIGPTKSAISKKVIVGVVNRTKKFILRDRESQDKLIDWGVKKEKVVFASDPAVLPQPHEITNALQSRLLEEYDIDSKFLEDFICIGPRNWFHYKTSGFLPFRYKQRLYKMIGRSIDTKSEKNELFISQITDMISTLSKEYNTNILLVPMHMDESDSDLCRLLRDHSSNPNKVRILDKDILSPSELRTVISRAKAMIGFRLHSNIIGISAGVPSINIYYVDKGRVFFDQIRQDKYAIPIEDTLDDEFIDNFMILLKTLLNNRDSINKDITNATSTLRKSVRDVFRESGIN